MAYKKVPQRAAAYCDAAAMRLLGLSRATFFRKLKNGLPAPEPMEGTQRRWWTEGDLEMAREYLQNERKIA